MSIIKRVSVDELRTAVQACIKRGDPATALDIARKALTDTNEDRHLYTDVLASAHFLAGEPARAYELWGTMLGTFPQSKHLRLNLLACLNRMGKWSEVITAIDKLPENLRNTKRVQRWLERASCAGGHSLIAPVEGHDMAAQYSQTDMSLSSLRSPSKNSFNTSLLPLTGTPVESISLHDAQTLMPHSTTTITETPAKTTASKVRDNEVQAGESFNELVDAENDNTCIRFNLRRGVYLRPKMISGWQGDVTMTGLRAPTKLMDAPSLGDDTLVLARGDRYVRIHAGASFRSLVLANETFVLKLSSLVAADATLRAKLFAVHGEEYASFSGTGTLIHELSPSLTNLRSQGLDADLSAEKVEGWMYMTTDDVVHSYIERDEGCLSFNTGVTALLSLS